MLNFFKQGCMHFIKGDREDIGVKIFIFQINAVLFEYMN